MKNRLHKQGTIELGGKAVSTGQTRRRETAGVNVCSFLLASEAVDDRLKNREQKPWMFLGAQSRGVKPYLSKFGTLL